MNWLLIVVAVLLLISTVIGYKKGLLKQGLILFGALILLWLMSFLLPYTREAIKEHTPVEIMISERVERMVQSRIDEMAEEKRDETLAQFNAYGNKSCDEHDEDQKISDPAPRVLLLKGAQLLCGRFFHRFSPVIILRG